MDPFELENLVVGLEASGLELLAFDPAVTSDGLWESPLPPMSIEHYRRLLAEVGSALDELVVAYIAIYGSRSQGPQDFKIGVRQLFPWLTKAISQACAHIEKRKVDNPSSSKEGPDSPTHQ
jgi:hypothetical protein